MWKGKSVTAKGLSRAVKVAAEVFDLPGKHFSGKSLRSGYVAHMEKCEVSREEYLRRGGWSTKSQVPQKHYIHRVVRGAFSTGLGVEGEAVGMSVSDISALVPVGAVGGSEPK